MHSRKAKISYGGGALFLVLMMLTGCGIKTTMRAPESMLSENPMKKVALLSAGKINWPGFRGKMCIRQSDSLKAAEAMLELTKNDLTARGYDVVAAEAVGAGFQTKDWWLLPETVADDAQKEQLVRITSEKPLYICPEFNGDAPYQQAVVTLYDQMEQAFNQGKIDQFMPDPALVATIAETTGADTICLDRVSGAKYTKGRKVGTAILSALFTTGGSGVSDAVGSYYVFIDARTGEVLWQHGHFIQGDPLAPKSDFMQYAFKYLPNAGQPFDSTLCEKSDKQGFIVCK